MFVVVIVVLLKYCLMCLFCSRQNICDAKGEHLAVEEETRGAAVRWVLDLASRVIRRLIICEKGI